MKQLVILSGKGGTGKTAISSSLAVLSRNALMVDCDVGASNLALLLESELLQSEPFAGGRMPFKHEEHCIDCGLCRDLCRFGAIDEALRIDPFACEGCALCCRLCPTEAIEMVPHITGEIQLSKTPYGLLVHSELGIGEEYGGRLVSELRRRAQQLAHDRGADLVIADGPPGIGCPVIATVTGADLALLVTEPSVSGIHDLDRVLRVTKHFGVPALVVVNKCDIDLPGLGDIERYCARHGIDVVGWIPFDRAVVRNLVRRRAPALDEMGPASLAIRSIWDVVRDRLDLPRRADSAKALVSNRSARDRRRRAHFGGARLEDNGSSPGRIER